MKVSFLVFFLAIATLSYAQPANDNQAAAIDVSAIINSCSIDATYTTVAATGDLAAASCWNTSPNFNVWFTFVATTAEINVTIDIGGSKGTLQRSQVAVWDTDGTTQLSCNRYVNNTDDISTGALGLTIGLTYYISVDNNNSSNRGTFTICLDDAVDYDFFEGAIDVSSIINSCSADAAYTTVGATSDRASGSNWNTDGGDPDFNRWFRFQATTEQINVTVDIGGGKGTMLRTQVALWTDNLVELSSNRYVSNSDDVITGHVGLTIGDWYYISVDNNYYAYRGTFTLCLDDAVDYDYFEGAIDVSSIINSCSADAAYTTLGATSDRASGSTWNTGGGDPDYNRWFKFQATTSSINVTVDIGGSKGTMLRSQIALWDENLVELASNRYVSNSDDISVGGGLLTIGKWYYISVDNNYYGYRGSFTLCLDDEVDYDYYGGAIDISASINGCTADAAYTTIGATGDKNSGSAWNTGGGDPDYNRWFKFQATSFAINVNIYRGGSLGTIQRIQVAIWDEDGETEIASNRYVSNTDNVFVGSVDLVPGNWYYISVDNNYYGYRGTFTICLDDDVDYDYFEGADLLTNLSDWSSTDAAYTTVGATSDKNSASSWNTGGGDPDYNRWFKFQATSTSINVVVRRGGSYGTIQRIQLALWEDDGTTEIASNRYVSNADDVSINATSLTPGDWYFIAVDNNYYGYRGTFSLYVNDAPDYDLYEGAIELADINNWCSADAAYSTLGATSDKNSGSCWNTGGGDPDYNRWFKFQAVTDGIQVTASRGGSLGTVQRLQVAIWEADGTTQVDCNRYVSDADDVTVGSNSLTPGDWYYISVDNNYYGYRGTFTLCVDDTPSYDYKDGAIELTDLDNWCSADAEYTTSGATGDETAASCWNTSPNFNRWFKFNAIYHTVTIDAKTAGASEGTIQRLQLALWDKDGIEVACTRYAGNADDLQIVQGSLNVGETYYISVDNNYYGYRGSFTLCVNNVSLDQYYAIADGDWNTPATWSKTEGGAAAIDTPGSSNKVHIKGFDVTVTGTEAAATLDVTVETAGTTLTVSGGAASLTVSGLVNLDNNGFNFDGSITATGGGAFTTNTDVTITRNGGANAFGLDVQTGSSMTIGNDLVFVADAGTVTNNTISLSGSGTLSVANDLNLDYNAGMKIKVTLDNTSSMTVARDIFFDTGSQNTTEVEINNTATINIGRNFKRNETPFGILDFNDDAILVLNTAEYEQVLSQNTGSGTDDFTYQNITINNTKVSSPQVTLEGDVNIPSTLTMTDGDVSTGAFTLTLGTSIGAIGTLSRTSGAIIGNYEKWVNHATTTIYNLPVGTSDNYRPAQITFNDTPTGTILATFEETAPTTGGLPLVDNALTYYDVFTEGYWTITTGNALASTDYDLTLEADGFDDFTISANTTLFTRPDSGSDWTGSGTQVAPSGNTIQRSSVATLSAEYAIVDNSCIDNTSSISGDTEVPENSISKDYFVTSNVGYTYTWTVLGGTIESGQSTNIIEVNWGAAVSGSVAVTADKSGLCTAPEVTLSVDVYGPIESNGSGGGGWDTPATWAGGIVPSTIDNATILSSDVVTMNSDATIRDLLIEGDLNNNGFVLTVTQDYTIDGTHISTGDDKVILSGVNTDISGSGILNLGGQFQITTGNKFILSGTDISVTTGNLLIGSGITVFNNGTMRFTEELEGAAASSTWENRPSSNLYLIAADADAILNTGTLVAGFTDNTIYYNRAGTQSIKVPQATEYYNLNLSCTTCTLLGEIIVLGTLTTSGTFDPDGNDFTVNGTWTNTGTFVVGTTTVTLSGTSNQSIEGTYYNLTVNKTLGSVSLTADVTVTNVLDMSSRNMVLGNFDLNISNTAAGAIINGSATSYIQPTGTGRIVWDLAVGNSMLYPVGDVNAYTPFTFLLNSGTLSTASISMRLVAAKHPNMAGTSFIDRYWVVENTGLTVPDYNASYTYADADINGTEADILPFKYSAGWNTGGSVTVGTNTLAWNNITSFSDFSGGDASVPLPVELLSFSAIKEEKKVKLEWITASELNNDYFTLERSYDGVDFDEFATVAGAGNSDQKINYSYLDNSPLVNLSYYRLKQTDYDGKYSYSSIVTFENKIDLKSTLTLYPNPSDGKTLKLRNTGENINQLLIEIYTIAGEKVYTTIVSEIGMNQKITISYNTSLPTGTYLIRLVGGSSVGVKKLLVR